MGSTEGSLAEIRLVSRKMYEQLIRNLQTNKIPITIALDNYIKTTFKYKE